MDIRSCNKIEKIRLFAGAGRFNWAKHPELRWVFTCRGLRELTVEGVADADVPQFAAIPSLRVLEITGECGGEASVTRV